MNEHFRATVMPLILAEFDPTKIEPPIEQPCQFKEKSDGWHSGYDVLCSKCGGCIDWPGRIMPPECKG